MGAEKIMARTKDRCSSTSRLIVVIRKPKGKPRSDALKPAGPIDPLESMGPIGASKPARITSRLTSIKEDGYVSTPLS